MYKEKKLIGLYTPTKFLEFLSKLSNNNTIMGLDTNYKMSSALTTLYKTFEVTGSIRIILKRAIASLTDVTVKFHKLVLRTMTTSNLKKHH